jgi:hypothetical protein
MERKELCASTSACLAAEAAKGEGGHEKGLFEVAYAACFSSRSGEHAKYMSVLSFQDERRVGVDVTLRARAVVSVRVDAMV